MTSVITQVMATFLGRTPPTLEPPRMVELEAKTFRVEPRDLAEAHSARVVATLDPVPIETDRFEVEMVDHE